MKSSRKTFAELQAWLDHWDENRAAPDAKTPNNWWKYRGTPYRVNPGPSWFTDAEVSDWDVIA